MSAHTQGQWSIRDDDEDGVVSIVGNSQIVIALVRTATVEPGDDNARLIAAAPELLEACQRLVEWRSTLAQTAALSARGAILEDIDDAIAAIAKATGGAQ